MLVLPQPLLLLLVPLPVRGGRRNKRSMERWK